MNSQNESLDQSPAQKGMPNSACASPDTIGRGHNLNNQDSKEDMRSLKNQQAHKKREQEKKEP